MPALATRTSTAPCSASTSSKSASTCAGSVMSQRTPATPDGVSAPRCVMVTLSPLAANAWAIARPIPRLPPVTRTDLVMPASFPIRRSAQHGATEGAVKVTPGGRSRCAVRGRSMRREYGVPDKEDTMTAMLVETGLVTSTRLADGLLVQLQGGLGAHHLTEL